LQATQRNAAMGEEKPSVGLVDESTVREKAKRAVRLRARAEALRQRRQDLLDRLDRMTLDLDAWKAQAALLSGLIEEEKQETAAPSTDSAAAPDEAAEASAEVAAPSDLTLRLREAQEAAISLDVRLFFQTVVRAKVRLGLLGQLIQIAEGEARGAEGKRDEFARALEQLRNQRQLDRLRADERLIEGWLARAKARKPKPKSPEGDRVRAYEAVLAVNEITQDAVEKRRRLSGAGLEPTGAPGAASDKEEKPPKATSANAGEATNIPLPKGDRRRLSPLTRDPDLRPWRTADVEVLRQEVDEPSLRSAYDADLVARHYAAATRQIQILEAALRDASVEASLPERFRRGMKAARASLEPLAARHDYVGTVHLPRMLEGFQRDFDESLKGIAAQRGQYEEELRALRSYRRHLLGLGTLSLSIRTNEDVRGEELLDAARSLGARLGNYVRLRGPHGGPGLDAVIARRWPVFLALLAALLLVIWGARRGRWAIDAWLERRALAIPALRWTGAGVREERSLARQRKAREQEAARAAVEKARLEAEAPPPTVPPEAKPEEEVDGEKATATQDSAPDTSPKQGAAVSPPGTGPGGLSGGSVARPTPPGEKP